MNLVTRPSGKLAGFGHLHRPALPLKLANVENGRAGAVTEGSRKSHSQTRQGQGSSRPGAPLSSAGQPEEGSPLQQQEDDAAEQLCRQAHVAPLFPMGRLGSPIT